MEHAKTQQRQMKEREKAKVRESLGRFLIKCEAERDVEYELQHPLYCSSHMRCGGKRLHFVADRTPDFSA